MNKFFYSLIILSFYFSQGFGQVVVPDMSVTKVDVVFKTHLDVGFTQLGNKVIDTYNKDFIPSVINLSKRLNQDSTKQSLYPWTTGSWLIWNYLQISSKSDCQRLTEAINRGDISWHALPFTIQTELCDSSLLESALFFSKELDKRFGRKTITAKITDVPGVTRSIIPILQRNGIHLLHIGANPGAAVPKVPEVFRWRDLISGSEINVIYQSGYGRTLRIPGSGIVVDINFTSDNHGPHSEDQIKKIYTDLHIRYPNAEIKGTSLNEVAEDVAKYEKTLPIITSEMGDTWIYGVQSDPRKIAEFRQLTGLRNKWIGEGKLIPHSDTDIRFTSYLLLICEHTWGLDVKHFLKNFDKYEFNKFPSFSTSDEYKLMEKSWNEKRAFISQAIAQLPVELQHEALSNLMSLTPIKPDMKDFKKLAKTTQIITTKFFDLSFDKKSGSINFLKEKTTGKVWCDSSHPWGEFTYQTYSGKSYDHFVHQYCPPKPDSWMFEDYGKHGLDKINVVDRLWNFELKELFLKKGKESVSLIVHLKLNQHDTVFGAPHDVYVEYQFTNKKPEIAITLNWFDKPKNRVPEAIWFSFVPVMNHPELFIDKLGEKVDVKDIVFNGARNVIGLTNYIQFDSKDTHLKMVSFDTPLIELNKRDILDFDNVPADTEKGVHFCLENTIWGTNYPQWFGDDMKFRFIIRF